MGLGKITSGLKLDLNETEPVPLYRIRVQQNKLPTEFESLGE